MSRFKTLVMIAGGAFLSVLSPLMIGAGTHRRDTETRNTGFMLLVFGLAILAFGIYCWRRYRRNWPVMTVPYRRLKIPFAIGAVLVAVAFALYIAFGKHAYVTTEQINQVKVGMTLDEVKAILGNYSAGGGVGESANYSWDTWRGCLVLAVRDDRVYFIHNYTDYDQWRMWTDRIRSKFGW